MAFSTSSPLLRPTQLYSNTLCKSPWTFNNSFKFHFPSPSPLTLSPPKQRPPLQPRFSPLLTLRTPCARIDTMLTEKHQEIPSGTSNDSSNVATSSGFSQSSANGKRVGRKNRSKSVSSVEVENPETTSAARDGDTAKRLDSSEKRGIYFEFSILFLESIRKYFEKNLTGSYGESNGKIEKGFGKQLGVNRRRKGDKKGKGKKGKGNPPEVMLKLGLDRCSKMGDVLGALILYDSARREGVRMDQSHYTILLYLCSSAATGGVQTAKSGSGGRSSSTLDPIGKVSTSDTEVSAKFVVSLDQWIDSGAMEMDYIWVLTEVGNENYDILFRLKEIGMVYNGKPIPQVKDRRNDMGIGDSESGDIKDGNNTKELDIGASSTMIKEYALLRGFEICNRMCCNEVPMNEASFTSVARLCMALGDGDMAFFIVKQMKPHGVNPRLRSYDPALSAFCNCGDVDKAFSVEKHMLEHGVYPEEPELGALLKVSIEASRSDKVYYLLHRFRKSVRKVSPSIAVLLEKWFTSKVASKVGKRKVDENFIREAIKNGGGGWHGQGWLGKGKWNVFRTSVGTDGLCRCCGQKLATVDLDPVETEKFAKSVASLAAQREKNRSFQQFQKWLDRCGPFEAVVDGANVGTLAKRKSKSSKPGLVEMLTRVNAVVNGVLPLLPSKKWPLIVFYHRRLTGYQLDKPVCMELIDKWKTVDALYATPTGSNDDWYWLYAAIKCKCLIVTNDEMRDHLFHLLGNDFFPRWKERHQFSNKELLLSYWKVRFSFSDNGLVIHMPPPYSIVIQESEKGHWHIPIASEHDYEGERTWLCITRGKSPGSTKVTATMHEDNHSPGAMLVTATIHEDNHSPGATLVTAAIHEDNHSLGATQVTASIHERNHSPEATQATATVHEGNHSPEATQATATVHEESQSPVYNKGSESSDTPTKTEAMPILSNDGNKNKDGDSKQPFDEFYERIKNILSTPLPSIRKDPTILPQIEAAEKLGGCVIDFEI
ncbi:hypothetical protein RHMOL_Rhmol01G0095100 [Rhododendron molle]|uniref:Uncharacterized protein n=1 Tax=Rhododendron molle TaxID=49168 RepID=A0ACC0PZX5_RHOML|nr:hypothetical protein RHMOL_Rhmol01G0095100 [Rhododendron molle]